MMGVTDLSLVLSSSMKSEPAICATEILVHGAIVRLTAWLPFPLFKNDSKGLTKGTSQSRYKGYVTENHPFRTDTMAMMKAEY